MSIIETLNPAAFSDYLKRYNNTICGRHPIGVMLQVFGKFSIFILDECIQIAHYLNNPNFYLLL